MGKEALMKYQTERLQLVRMDIRKLGIDGIEGLASILGKDRQASVVINTAYSQHRENFMIWGKRMSYQIPRSEGGERT